MNFPSLFWSLGIIEQKHLFFFILLNLVNVECFCDIFHKICFAIDGFLVR